MFNDLPATGESLHTNSPVKHSSTWITTLAMGAVVVTNPWLLPIVGAAAGAALGVALTDDQSSDDQPTPALQPVTKTYAPEPIDPDFLD